VARILVIEDEADVRNVCCLLLQPLGHNPEGVVRGERSLLSPRVGSYDLVPIDLQLPGMDGWAVARAVKQRSPGTRVGLMTAEDFGFRKEELLARGIDFWLPKPFDLDLADRLISEALSQ